MEHFLQAMARPTGDQRRNYERLAGAGLSAVFASGPHKGTAVLVNNLSRGGIALTSDWSPRARDLVAVALGGSSAPIAGRVIRTGDGALALAFAQDPANLALVDQALSAISGGVRHAA